MSNNISIILSTFNEKLSIEFTISELIKYLPGVEIIVVDDNSPDGTLEVLKKINYENLKIFSRKKTKGLASAFLLGLINTSGDIIGWLDSNMGDTAKKFPEMLQNLKGADIVILSRYVAEGKDERNKIRVIASYLLNKFSKLILRSKINDLSSGIFLMKREVLNDVVPVAKGHGEFMMEFLYKAEKKGNKIIEIPYIQPIDIEGHSKSFPNIAKFLYLGFFYLVRIIQSIITK
jgi:dolichol-phosphate mannosyltransferase